MDAGESSGLRRDRRSSNPRRLGERRYPWTIHGNPEYARICEEPGACPLPPSKEVTVVAEWICGIPNSPQGQASCPCVLLHPDRGNERYARLARYLGDTKTSIAEQSPSLIRSGEGLDLFRAYCTSCHGSEASSDQIGLVGFSVSFLLAFCNFYHRSYDYF